MAGDITGPAQLAPIVTPDWLADRLADDDPGLVVVDIRFYLDGRDGLAAHLAGHLPGAVYLDLEQVLAAPASPEGGRHPLPSPEVFAAGLGSAGIGPGTPVVAYDDLGGMVAGRLVWMLRILGEPAALLDGGLGAWPGPVETGPVPAAAPVERPAVPWPASALATADEVAAHVAAGGVVVDSRAADRYRGDHEPIDPAAGHIPGAVNLPFAGNLDDTQRFRPLTELAARFADAGVDDSAIVYCGSGVSACNNLLAAEAAGRGRPRLFVGSWSAWSADPARPVATGPEP